MGKVIWINFTLGGVCVARGFVYRYGGYGYGFAWFPRVLEKCHWISGIATLPPNSMACCFMGFVFFFRRKHVCRTLWLSTNIFQLT